jgi:hypothetical protein
MLVQVGLSRYSSGGKATLEFRGETSTVQEYDAEYKKHMEAKKGSLDAYKLPTEVVKAVAGEGI